MALTLGLTAAGAVAGGFFGNPMLGAQLGMVAGSIASALLFPGGADQKGPRLGDLRVGDASYGMPIPIVYGAARVAGNMFWTSGLEERSNEESMKGGGPTSTTYTYYSSFAIGLCAGPLASVRKIWLDTKLVYDVSRTNLGIVNQRLGELDPRNLLTEEEQDDKTDEIQAELAKVSSALTIYLGTETQLPDAVMEAHEGAGNVPAYRGLAYLLFEDLALQPYGNRIPTVSAEVMTQSSIAYPTASVPTDTTINRDQLVFDAARQQLWMRAPAGVVQIDTLTRTTVLQQDIDTVPSTGYALATPLHHAIAVADDGFLYLPIEGGGIAGGNVVRLDPTSLEVTHLGREITTSAPAHLGICSTLTVSTRYVWYASYVLSRLHVLLRPAVIDPRTGVPSPQMWLLATVEMAGGLDGLHGAMLTIDRDETAWAICSPSVSTPGGRTVLVHYDAAGMVQTYDVSTLLGSGTLIAYDSQGHQLLLGGYVPGSSTTRIVRWDISTQTRTGELDGALSLAYEYSGWTRGVIGRRLWYPQTVTQFGALDVDTMTLVRTETVGGSGFPGGSVYGGVYDPAVNAMWMAEDATGPTGFYLDRLEAAPVTLASIIADLSRRAGLAEGDVETTTLSDTVHGFVVSQQAEARAAVDSLCAAFLTDGVEQDWRLVFAHRAQAPVATLTVDDLAAHEPGARLPDCMTPQRLDDQALPIRLDVTYPDPARDYQDATQHARRFQAGQRARSNREVRMPVIMTATQARHLAEQSLTEAWVSRMTYTLPVTYRWTTLDPGDVIEVDLGGRRTLMRLQQIANGANGILECTAVAYDRALYSASLSVGTVADALTQQTLTMTAPTLLMLMDTPLLRDVDAASGYYLAMAPQGSGGWSGAVALSSVDGSAWREEATLTSAASYGSALTRLEVGSPYVIDRGHTIDVRMARGALTSCSETEMLNGANAALLGDEIIQWATATPLDATSWRLSTLLRGRRGSNFALETHASGERFVVLTTAAIRREAMGLSEVGTTRLYRAVSAGADVLTSTSVAFVNTDRSLKPYSVDHVRGTRDISQNLTLTWIRRTRIGGAWADGHDVPLAEANEQYVVDIVNGATVVRTLESSIPSALYSASEQTADFGVPQSSITVAIFQLGLLGRGWPKTATL